ncbi:hypothetical protein MLD38_028750 [Melastoma candidum]|uniref:Uncharacterized protein n=1 Tax=Melastoma candidum TaxID=119954 RepID=A0ACB9N3I8_9MYRT|nr:hypothetical protein MLD38_028750 [Melastoma candidum]
MSCSCRLPLHRHHFQRGITPTIETDKPAEMQQAVGEVVSSINPTIDQGSSKRISFEALLGNAIHVFELSGANNMPLYLRTMLHQITKGNFWILTGNSALIPSSRNDPGSTDCMTVKLRFIVFKA